ncbi:MAG: hypothetical protein IPL20_03270 [Saprospiraceae bacterium]|nr:hypothetical protein [Saprospiraceae bacterium]
MGQRQATLFYSLMFYINNLKDGCGKDLFKLYNELFEPWYYYRPNPENWGNEWAAEELEFRKNIFLAACINIDQVENIFKVHKKAFKTINNKNYPEEVTEKLNQICIGISKNFNDKSFQKNHDIRLNLTKYKAIYLGIDLFLNERKADTSFAKELSGKETGQENKNFDYGFETY